MKRLILLYLILLACTAAGSLYAARPAVNASVDYNKWVEITDPNTIKSMVNPADYLAAGSLEAAIISAPVPKTIPKLVSKIQICNVKPRKGQKTRQWAKLFDAEGNLLAWAGSVDGGKWNNPIVAAPFIKPPYLGPDGELKFDHSIRDSCIAAKALGNKIKADDINKDKFSFAIFNDTHIKCRGWNKNHTGLLLLAIGEVLIMPKQPDFLVVTGDLDSCTGDARYSGKYVHAGNLQNWLSLVSLLQMPVYPVTGNHDPRFAFRWLILGQQKPTTEPACYSFNAGKWHMVILENRPINTDKTVQPPHFQKIANWLEEDLKKNKNRPVMVFSHDPMVRITCQGFYSNEIADRFIRPLSDRNIILDILIRHGNVKCVFNGHIHCYEHVIYKGINFISTYATMGNNYNGKFWSRTEWWDNGWTLVEVDGYNVTVFKKKIGEKSQQILSDSAVDL